MKRQIIITQWLTHLLLSKQVFGWLIPWIFNLDTFNSNSFHWTSSSGLFNHCKQLPLLFKLIGFFADGVGTILLVLGWWHLQNILRRLSADETFSLEIVDNLYKISRLALIWVCCSPVLNSISGLLQTWNSGHGKRILSIGFGSDDLQNILLYVILFLLANLIKHGAQLEDEHKLTV